LAATFRVTPQGFTALFVTGHWFCNFFCIFILFYFFGEGMMPSPSPTPFARPPAIRGSAAEIGGLKNYPEFYGA
jgi:hypothetical protein